MLEGSSSSAFFHMAAYRWGRLTFRSIASVVEAIPAVLDVIQCLPIVFQGYYQTVELCLHLTFRFPSMFCQIKEGTGVYLDQT